MKMAEETGPRFRQETAFDKARECRELARRVWNPEHRSALIRMAEAWEELARTLPKLSLPSEKDKRDRDQ